MKLRLLAFAATLVAVCFGDTTLLRSVIAKKGAGGGGGGEDAYYTTVMSYSPIAYYRLNETSPSGAGSIVDETGNYNATPSGSLSYGYAGGPYYVGNTCARSDGGYINCGSSLASASIGSGTGWTVTFWYYPEGSSGNTPIGAAASGTDRFATLFSGGSLYTYSNDGGAHSTGNGEARYGWRHIAITSTGVLYVDGTAAGGTSSTGFASTTVDFNLFALNDGTRIWEDGYLDEVAIFDTVLAEAAVDAMHNAGRPAAGVRADGLTLQWGAETDDVEATSPGLPLRFSYYPDSGIRSSAKARTGTWSILADGAFDASKIWHDINAESWMPLNEGTIQFYVNFNTVPSTSSNLTFIFMDGKTGWSSSPLDGNSSQTIRWNNSTEMFTFNAGGVTVSCDPGTLSTDTWYEIVARWRESAGGGNTIEFSVAGTTVTSTSALSYAGFDVTEYHSILFGNDLTGSTPNCHYDDIKVWNYWNASP